MRIAIAFALITMLGCHDASDDVTPPVAQVAGTYVLSAIDGAPLPATYFSTVKIASSRLVVVDAGTWTETRTSDTAGKVETATYFGTWKRTGSTLEFSVGATPFYAGAATSSGLRLDTGSKIFTYSRE